MRQAVTAARVREFMRRLGTRFRVPDRWDLGGSHRVARNDGRHRPADGPDDDDLLRAMVRLKTGLDLNVELASPSDFIPPLPGWRERSRFIEHNGQLSFFHYDFYAQALSKIERGHSRDRTDVREMLTRGLIQPDELLRLFEAIEGELFRYPALHAAAFRGKLMHS